MHTCKQGKQHVKDATTGSRKKANICACEMPSRAQQLEKIGLKFTRTRTKRPAPEWQGGGRR